MIKLEGRSYETVMLTLTYTCLLIQEKIYRAMSAIGYTVADTFTRKDENVQDTTKLS